MNDLNRTLGLNDLSHEELESRDRRATLKIGACGLILASVPLVLSSPADASASRTPWRISFRNAHTGESFNGVYRVGDKYLPDAFRKINLVMRDFRTNEVFPMDPRAIDILNQVQKRSGQNKPLEVLSGYRSPKTNAMLRSSSSGVARKSMHMYGQAVDFRMPGYSTRRLRDIARGLKAGGVGFYSRSDFIHVDTGKVRSW